MQETFAAVDPIADTAAGLFYRKLFEVDPSTKALLWTLKDGLKQAFTAEAEQAWAKAYSIMAEVMMMGAQEPPATRKIS